jgi:hypothetical protein
LNARTRAARTTAVVAAVPAAVLGLVLGLTAGWIAGLIVAVVIAGALGLWVRYGGDRVVERHLGGRPAVPATEARLINLVEGLSIGAGVRQPRLVVVDSPGLNALAAGSSASRALVAVTAGLLSELDRVELEAVLAAQLWLIRHDETIPATALVATFGLGRSWTLGAGRDTAVDQGAISLTRYPPALASALEKVEAKGAGVAGQPSYMSQLWFADPRSVVPPSSGRTALRERIEAMREL